MQSRREFIKTLSIGTGALMMPGLLQAGQRKPNIIYILLDDAGYGDIGAFGQQQFKTPNIDRLASQGMRFTNHYSGSTVCAPSRCALLTGQHTGHTHIRGNREVYPEGQAPLPAGTTTIASMLKEAGYSTACIGKWGLGYPGSSGDPQKQGFDHFFGYKCQRKAHNHYPWSLWRNDQKVMTYGRDYSQDLFSQEALDFVSQNKDNPFFLYLAFAIPHSRLQVPDTEPYRKERWPLNMKKFAAMMSHMDRDVGRLMDRLDELGISEDTLVMLSSDNGPHKEGGARPEYFDSNGPYRGIKRDLYEGGIRVPMIARWSGTIAPGQTSDHVSAFWDILPTCAEAAGVSAPENIDGISILPTLKGAAQKEHDYLYWEFPAQGGKQAIRKGDWKALRLNLQRISKPRIELYNLKDDPGEQHNIADQHPEIVKEMAELFVTARTDSKLFRLHK